MSAVGEAQARCDYAACGKTVWRTDVCRAGAKRFCTPECRNLHWKQREGEAADNAIHVLNHAYGEGFLCGVVGGADHSRRRCGCGELVNLFDRAAARHAIDDQHMQGGRDGDACSILDETVPEAA